jgi:hypothetical protein
LEDRGDLRSQLLALLQGGSDSIVAIAVGCAEGTRTADGGKTAAWYGHTDPGNGAKNQGSFSYQHEAKSPEDADILQIQKLTDVLLPQFLVNVDAVNLPEKGMLQLFLIACDVYTQSELACTGRGGFLWHFRSIPLKTRVDLTVIDWRVESYFDLDTLKLDAPGFGNNLERLKADQARRTEAVMNVFLKSTIVGVREAIA